MLKNTPSEDEGAAAPRTFTVIALFEAVTEGSVVRPGRWPAHVTLAPRFGTSAPQEDVEAASFPPGVVSYPLVLRFGATTRRAGDGRSVQAVEHVPVGATHRRLANRLGALQDFAAEDPAGWQDGYRPHLTLAPGIAPAAAGALRRVHSVALAEVLVGAAIVRVVREIEDLAPMDRLDVGVAIPADERPEDVEVVAHGADLEFPAGVTLQTRGGLRISTVRREGVRWRPWGWAPPEETLARAAEAAIGGLLVRRVPSDSLLEDFARNRVESDERAAHLAAQLRDTDIWSVGPIDVDGVRFALFSARIDHEVIAVLDLGFSQVTITGTTLPDDLALRLVPASELRRWHPRE